MARKDIELSVGFNTKDLESQSKEIERLVSKALNSSGSNASLKSTAYQLQTAYNRARQLNTEVERLRTTRVPTDAYAQLTQEINDTQEALDNVYDRMQQMEEANKAYTYSDEYQQQLEEESRLLDIATDRESRLNTIREGMDNGTYSSTGPMAEYYNRLQAEIDETNIALTDCRARMEQMREEGNMLESTPAFSRLEQQATELEGTLDNLTDQEAQMRQTGQDSTFGINTTQGQRVVQQANTVNSLVDILSTRLKQAKKSSTGLSDSWKSFKNKATSAIRSVVSSIKGKLQNAIRSAKNTSNSSFSSMLKKVLAYGAGILSISSLFSKIRSTISDGLDDMADQFSDVNTTTNSLKNSWNGFKSSIVSAFEPIYNYVVPALTTMIDYLTEATNSLANFFANLTGASTYKKAIKTANDYSDAVSETGDAADESSSKLADYDEILEISTDDSSSSSSSSSSDTSDWKWEEVATETSDWADTILSAFTDWDFTEVGSKLKDALISALKSIDWDTIYEYAINFGTGLATFLNGLIDEDLFSELGSTLAKALKTALLSINTFAETFEWDELGDSIAAGVNAFFEDFDITLAADTFSNVVKGILTTLTNAIKGIKWSDISDALTEGIQEIDTEGIGEQFGSLVSSITNAFYTLVSNSETWISLGTKISDGINGFFESMAVVDDSTGLNGWQALGEGFTDTILGFGEMITTALEGVDWEAVGQAVVDFFTSISWTDLFQGALDLKHAIEDAIEGILSGMGIDADIDLVTVAIGGLILGSAAKTLITTTLPKLLSTECMSVVGSMGSVSAGTVMVSVVLAATIGWQIGTNLYESASGHEVEQGFIEEIQDIIQGFGEDQIEFNLLDFIEFTVEDSEGWYKDYAEWAGGLGDTLYDLFHTHIPGIIDEFVPAWQEIASGFWTSLTDGFKDLINWDEITQLFDKDTWSDFWSYLCQDIMDIFSPITEWFKSTFGDSIDAIKELFDPNTWSDFWGYLWEDIKDIFGGVKDWFSGIFSDAWDAICGVFDGVGDFFTGIWDSITGVFEGVGDWFSEKWDEAYDAVTGVFDSIAEFFSGIWDTISTAFTDFGSSISSAVGSALTDGLNSLMGFFEDTLNDAIDIINTIIDKLNFLDLGEGSESGEYISHVDLPEFARGGIASRATLGIFGEAGTEAIMPLENNLGWLDKLAGMIVERAIPSIVQGLVLPMSEEFMKALGSSETSMNKSITKEDIVSAVSEAIELSQSSEDHSPIYIQLSGKQVAEVVWSESEKRYKQTGLRPAYT